MIADTNIIGSGCLINEARGTGPVDKNLEASSLLVGIATDV